MYILFVKVIYIFKVCIEICHMIKLLQATKRRNF